MPFRDVTVKYSHVLKKHLSMSDAHNKLSSIHLVLFSNPATIRSNLSV